MTRWARGGQGKKEHEASSWDELKPSKKQHHFKQKGVHKPGLSENGVQKNGAVSEKVEKQRAARRMRRKKGKLCFHCRKSGLPYTF